MINSRVIIVAGFLFIVLIVLILKLFTIQINKHEYYVRVAENQQYNPRDVKAERGLIKDINGEVLCYTFNSISFFVNKNLIKGNKEKVIETIASKFSNELGKSKEYYINLIKNGKNNICIERKVPLEKAINLKHFYVDGLSYEEDFSRIYPYGNTASHILGFVNKEGKAEEGLEKFYDKYLRGQDGKLIYEKDVLGRIISLDEKLSINPENGNSLILTINKNYQKILEEEIKNGLEKYGGESAVGIIMNPNTGEILALANSPDFDPTNFNNVKPENRKNRAITDPIEPGSTMKPLTFSILFEETNTNENEIVNAENGTYSYKNVKIYDSHKYSDLTVAQVLQISSNIGTAKLSERLDKDIFYKYLRDFGFSNKTAVDLPSESEGRMTLPKNFTGITKAFMSFGYELLVTPLQLTTAYCALVNGGNLYKPFIVKKIVDKNGNTIEEKEPQKIRTVISQKTSERIKKLMIDVVEKGTGTAAQLPDVLVGGKTGTSQRLVDNSYSSSHHNSSFIGFFPAENPKFVIYILLNSPTKAQYGGLVAAPIFHDVAKRIIESDPNLITNKKKIKHDEKLIDQLIADLKSAPKTTRSYLNVPEIKEEKKNRVFKKTDTIPNLINNSMRDAIAKLNALGIKWKVVGTGKVVWQSLEPGSPFSKNDVCFIKCENSTKKINQNETK
ncbi:MAG: penicillin-binding protein [Stygiobacter sp.]|jgi:cell division protein FtsI (penicillin-binding protein 3)|uniref:Penicillin-binding protein n=1 Tax=Stygiobacter electus TaxID=3032292 RepID=A0AAE3NU16_9BACT|nr:penicillin-binding protein [Stygiobacter electus]MDF1610871.1 penicillin-binding protein [Stygiobacter electus]